MNDTTQCRHLLCFVFCYREADGSEFIIYSGLASNSPPFQLSLPNAGISRCASSCPAYRFGIHEDGGAFGTRHHYF